MRLKKRTHPSAKKLAVKNRRSRPLEKSLNFWIELTVILLIAGGAFLTWHYHFIDNYSDRLMQVVAKKSSNIGLKVEHIYVEGHHHISNKELLDLIAVKKGQSLLEISLSEIKARLETHSWIDQAIVERQYPDTLHVHIVERIPMAIWQYQKNLYLLDQRGEIISGANINQFSNLLTLVGQDAPNYAESLFSMLISSPQMFNQIKAAIRVSQRRWNIRLASGIDIKLPENNPEKAWQYLVSLEQEKKLLRSDISSIDLRIPGKLYIKMQQPSV